MRHDPPPRPGLPIGLVPRPAPPVTAARTEVLWRVAIPGVCRLVDDPEQLARLARRHPDASITRLGRGRPI
jgi:hypothetical protein